MRKQRDSLIKEINDLTKAIEKADPLSCDLNAFIKGEEGL